MHLSLIPGHGWRAAQRYDPGATNGTLSEAKYVRDLAEATHAAHRRQVSVHDSPETGPYTYQSRRRAGSRFDGPLIVLQLHANSMPVGVPHPDRIKMFYDPESKLGKARAEHWARIAEPILGRPCQAVAADPRQYTNAHNLLKHSFNETGPDGCGLLLETGFVKNRVHLQEVFTAEGIQRHVQALAAAFLE